ncbi:MAG TPA: cytochrome b N-terminal domain-containing protein [Planctomicrobium sp.]|nr:cytochrome b N-terminal domain-containing protein [Planctomicrobium sp.]
MSKFFDWLNDRTGYRVLLEQTLYANIPGGARWRYSWGAVLLFTFGLLMLTGTTLWMSYSPSATTAWESVFYIQNEMPFGWLVRGVHHFAAQAMMVLLLLHLMQIVIFRAYQAPREVNFWLGLLLMQMVMVLGVTGYLLPWDQRGYAATQIVTGIIGSVPFVGPSIQQVVQGGTGYGNLNITRFFAIHAGILPFFLLIGIFFYLGLFRRHGRRTDENPQTPDARYWPDQFLRDGIACLTVLITILACTFYWGGAELTAPADPAQAYSAARPEWYYLFLFKLLSLPWVVKTGAETGLGESFGAVILPGIFFLIIVLMPLIARLRYGHRFNVAFLWVVVGIIGTLTGMALHADWIADTPTGHDFRKSVAAAHIDAHRVTELALSPAGIPPEGAANLLKNDPLTQGPKLFETYCISCHQPAGWKDRLKDLATAPELADPDHRTTITFASRDWMKSVLTQFDKHFDSLKQVQGDHAEAAQAILEGSMKDWSESNGPTLLEAENAEDLQALIEFLYTQSGRPDALPPDAPQVQRGQEIFTSGELASGTIDACVDCHALRPVVVIDGVRGFAEEALAEDLFPDLTGYGSTAWLKKMIARPQEIYAGDSGNNAMPAFEDQLSEKELDLLARWLSQDYLPTKH